MPVLFGVIKKFHLVSWYSVFTTIIGILKKNVLFLRMMMTILKIMPIFCTTMIKYRATSSITTDFLFISFQNSQKGVDKHFLINLRYILTEVLSRY